MNDQHPTTPDADQVPPWLHWGECRLCGEYKLIDGLEYCSDCYPYDGACERAYEAEERQERRLWGAEAKWVNSGVGSYPEKGPILVNAS